MALWERSDWKGGFPFTQSRLGAGSRAAASVVAPGLQDPPSDAPAPPRTAAAYGRVVVPDALTIRVAPASRRFAPRKASLRLLPLGAFAWGAGRLVLQPRTRPDHVLIYVTEGRMRLDFPRSGGVLVEGDVRFIPAGTAFAARVQPGAQGHVLLLSPELAVEVDPPLPCRVTAGCAGQAAASLATALQDLMDEAARATDRKALGCHLNLLSLRLSRLDPERDLPAAVPQAGPDRPLVDRFLALAGMQLGSPRTLAELAQDLGTTLTQLDRACLEARGRRAIDLVHELRVERAAEMLRHTDRPTSRIAQELGYASHAHFTRTFVAATGRTPETYRQQMR